jgi:hypothetical protein
VKRQRVSRTTNPYRLPFSYWRFIPFRALSAHESSRTPAPKTDG